MTKPFNELTAQLWKKRDERYYKVIQWLELETDHREGRLVAFTQEHYDKLKLEEELFGGPGIMQKIVYIVMEKHYNEYPFVVKVFFDLDKARELANKLSEKSIPDVVHYVDPFIVEKE